MEVGNNECGPLFFNFLNRALNTLDKIYLQSQLFSRGFNLRSEEHVVNSCQNIFTHIFLSSFRIFLDHGFVTDYRQENRAASTSAATEIETGDFAPLPKEMPESTTIIVASCNVRYARGSHLISGGLGRRFGLSMPR